MKIAVAMSGGVDSTVVAYLLKEQGHDVTGFTAKLFDDQEFTAVANAKKCADYLGIEHRVIDLSGAFTDEITGPFCQEYLAGRTPSPCIRCNRLIKFGKFYDVISGHGFDMLATGHYASIAESDGRYFITKGNDLSKDQSYFLFGLTQSVLAHILFPLSGLSKDEVWNIAHSAGVPAAKSKESQEICFITDNDYKRYVAEHTSTDTTGNIVDMNGNVLKKHEGIYRYTIGQRRGLGISYSEPLYVININADKKEIVVGTKEYLYKNGVIAEELNFQKWETFKGEKVWVKVRSTHKPELAVATLDHADRLRLEFPDRIFQVSPGQAAVVYDDDGAILGGGWIKESF